MRCSRKSASKGFAFPNEALLAEGLEILRIFYFTSFKTKNILFYHF